MLIYERLAMCRFPRRFPRVTRQEVEPRLKQPSLPPILFTVLLLKTYTSHDQVHLLKEAPVTRKLPADVQKQLWRS